MSATVRRGKRYLALSAFNGHDEPAPQRPVEPIRLPAPGSNEEHSKVKVAKDILQEPPYRPPSLRERLGLSRLDVAQLLSKHGDLIPATVLVDWEKKLLRDVGFRNVTLEDVAKKFRESESIALI